MLKSSVTNLSVLSLVRGITTLLGAMNDGSMADSAGFGAGHGTQWMSRRKHHARAHLRKGTRDKGEALRWVRDLGQGRKEVGLDRVTRRCSDSCIKTR